MPRIASLALCACLLAIFAFAAGATADPGEEHADDIPPPQPTQPASPPGSQGIDRKSVV